MPPNNLTAAQVTAMITTAINLEAGLRLKADAAEATNRATADAAEAKRAGAAEDSLAQRLADLAAELEALQAAQTPVPDPVPTPPPVETPPPPAPVPTDGLPSDINALQRTGGTIYEYGDLFTYPAPNGGAAHAPYTVNGITVQNHFWGSRWYDGKFVVKNKIADLIAAKLIPPFNASLANVNMHVYAGMYDSAGLPNPITYSGPMDYQLPAYMGQTGDVPSIGPYSEWESALIALGDDSVLYMDVASLACNGLTLPIHTRDPKTGRPISYKDYPQFTTFPGQENSMVAPGLRTAIVGFTPTPPGISFDAGHHPQYFALMALLTDDPVWCEELQYLATECWSSDYPENDLKHVGNLQVREMAWDMMTIVNTITVTRYFEKKGVLPATCHPSQYFMDVMLTPTIAWLSNFFGDTSPLGYAKVLMYTPFVYAPWQWDFFTTTCGLGVYGGIEELRPVFNWAAAGLVERLTGKQGWNARYPSFYYSQNPTTWDAAFADACAGDPALIPDDPAQVFPPRLMDAWPDYLCWAGAAARVGKLIGHTDLTTLSPAYDAKIKASGIPVNYRHCIGSPATVTGVGG